MKKLLFSSLILFSASSWAGKCLLSGLVKRADSCHRISTRLDVSDIEACRAFAQSSQNSKFFGQLDTDEKLVSIRYLYRVSLFKRLKGSVEFEDQNSCHN